MFKKRNLLSAALLAAAFPAVAASDAVQGQGFFADSKVNLNLRTFYFNRDKVGATDAKALSQALRLDFESGYINNIIGFDASVFSSLKLSGERGEGGTGILNDNGNEQESYTKIGQAAIKLKLGENTKFKAGRVVIDYPLLNDSDSRATPSATQAAILETSVENAKFYAVWSDRASSKTNDSFDKYTDSNGDDYDVKTIGASYQFHNGVSVDVAYAEAEDVLNQKYVKVSYPWQLSAKTSLNFDGFYYSGEADGSAQGHVGADYDSDLYNVAAQLKHDNTKLTLSYQQVDGDEYEETWGADDDNGLNTWNSVQRLDFDRADEKSWQLRLDYDVKQVKGLSLMTRYTRGDNIDNGTSSEGKEWERNFEVKYAFQQVDGLSLRLRNSTVRSTETVDTNENRLILNYNIAFK